MRELTLEQLRRFFKLCPTLFCTANNETGCFEQLNPAWEATLGWSLDELRARPWATFVHPEDLQPTIDLVSERMARGELAIDFENRYQHKSGHWVWLSWNGRLAADGIFYSVARDVTAIRHAISDLRVANEELQHFAYAASHDLQEPVRTVAGHLALIDDARLDPESLESLEFARAGAAQLHALIEGLLQFSRVETREEPPEHVALATVVDDALLRLSAQAQDASAKITIDSALPGVTFDRAQLAQAVQNVISNALKYHKPREAPRVHVSATTDPTDVLLHIRDEGVGFHAARAERAFQLFQRLHRRSQFDGTGVGLAVVRRILRRHGGDATLVTKEGEGTTVTLRIPRHWREK